MEEKDLEFFRNLLIQRMEELLDHAEETVEELLDPQEKLADPLDRRPFLDTVYFQPH